MLIVQWQGRKDYKDLKNMILIKNTQRSIHVNVEHIERDVEKILHALHYDDFDIGIWLTTNATIKKYNNTYRQKNKPTDILSFSFYPEIKPGNRIIAKSPEDKNLGDLIVSVEYVEKAAHELGQTLQKRLQILLVHGICHLLGYDHERDEDYKIMQAKENFLLKKIVKE